MAAKTSRSVTIAAKWLDGGLVKGAEESGAAVKGLAGETRDSDDQARKAGGGWSYFQKQTDSAGKSASKAGGHFKGMIGSIVGMGLAVGGGMLALSTIKSSIDSVSEKAIELRQAQTMGIGKTSIETMAILAAYKARDIGMSQLSMTMKTLAKSSFTAEKQEGTHAKQSVIAVEQRQRKLEQYGRAVAKWEAGGKKGFAPLPLAPPKELAEIGIKAKAYESLGIVVSKFRKLSGTEQLKEIGDRLTKMPVGPERTRLAVELLGRSAQKMLPAFEKGEGNISNMEKYAAKAFKGIGDVGAEGSEKFHISQMKMGIDMEAFKMQIGLFMLPVMGKLVHGFTTLYSSINEGRGVWGPIKNIVKGFVSQIVEVIDWFGKTKWATKALLVVLGFLALAWGVQKVVKLVEAFKALWLVTKLQVAAQWLLNDAMDANPIGIVILAVMALIAVGVLVVTHWKQVKNFFSGLWDWFKTNGPHLVGWILGPFSLGAVWAIKHWRQVVHFFEGLPSVFAKIGESIWYALLGSFKWLINTLVVTPLNEVLHGLHKAYASVNVPGLPSWPIPDPAIPKLAKGGYIRHGGWAVVGDKGPEAIHLPMGARVDPLSKRGGGTGIGGSFEGPSGDLHVHVDVDRREIATAVLKDFRFRGARA